MTGHSRSRSKNSEPARPMIPLLEREGWGRALAAPPDEVSHYYYPPAIEAFGPYWYSACAKSTTTTAPAIEKHPRLPCVVCRTILLAKEDIAR